MAELDEGEEEQATTRVSMPVPLLAEGVGEVEHQLDVEEGQLEEVVVVGVEEEVGVGEVVVVVAVGEEGEVAEPLRAT